VPERRDRIRVVGMTAIKLTAIIGTSKCKAEAFMYGDLKGNLPQSLILKYTAEKGLSLLWELRQMFAKKKLGQKSSFYTDEYNKKDGGETVDAHDITRTLVQKDFLHFADWLDRKNRPKWR